MLCRSSIVVLVMGVALAAPAQMPAVKPGVPIKAAATPTPVKEVPPAAPHGPSPIPQMSPEQLPAQPPRVSYQGGILSIDSQNASLADILHEIHNQTGTQIDMPSGLGRERVAAHFLGAPRDVVNGLLEGSKVGFI